MTSNDWKNEGQKFQSLEKRDEKVPMLGKRLGALSGRLEEQGTANSEQRTANGELRTLNSPAASKQQTANPKNA
jgi:hypothetical protein